MKIESQAVHTGERKPLGRYIPVATPIYTASSYVYQDIEDLDRVFGREQEGESYARYSNPNSTALEELLTQLEAGAGSLVTSSGMMAISMAIQAALTDRRKSIVAASALYGATIGLLTRIIEPQGVAVRFTDFNDLEKLRQVIAEEKPGCLLMETISNPLLRVAEIDKIAQVANDAGAALIVDSTFATPMLCRPLELGAHMVTHSLTKYISGHGDVLGGSITADAAHNEILHAMSRTLGPVLGPFECYLTSRGAKTYPLRFERQCQNAQKIARFLTGHPSIDRVYYPSDPAHPDAATIDRLFSPGLFGAIVSFELKHATTKQDVFRFMNALKMIVPATSLGDVHSMMLYPLIASHRELSPKHRERMGIRDNLVRLSLGIEASEDVIADLDQALGI
jgi:cystathionine beta-lyase/cystathionine gamma-synthase